MANRRLIDLDKIKPIDFPSTEMDGIDVVRYLNTLPTVNAVEVVRCKDCKHYDNSEGIQWCKLNSKFYPGGFDWHSFPEDGFCYYGERRTDV